MEPEVHNRVHKTLPLGPILSHISTLHATNPISWRSILD